MRFVGELRRHGRWWAAEVPDLGLYTQGQTKKEAHTNVRDAVSLLVEMPISKITLHAGSGLYFEVGSDNDAALIAFFLRRQRVLAGKTLQQVAKSLGQTSINAYARYEQGRAVPTIEKLAELLRALEPTADIVIKKAL